MSTDAYDPHISSELLVGRDNEISQIVTDVKNNKNSSRWLVIGESGIDKSALLDKLYTNIVNDIDNYIFVGYYDKNQSQIAETTYSITRPFNIALSSLIKRAHDTQNLKEKINITTNRLKKLLQSLQRKKAPDIVCELIKNRCMRIRL